MYRFLVIDFRIVNIPTFASKLDLMSHYICLNMLQSLSTFLNANFGPTGMKKNTEYSIGNIRMVKSYILDNKNLILKKKNTRLSNVQSL